MIVDSSFQNYGKYCFLLYIRFQEMGSKRIDIYLLLF